MRWLFCNPRDQQESAWRQAMLETIDAWWAAFQEKAGDLDALFSRRADWDLPEWMAETLQAIDPHLFWEFGPAAGGSGHRLVITPETRRHLRPLVATILQRAPKTDGWEFYGYRLAEDVEAAERMVGARTGGTLAGVLAEARVGEDHLVDLVFRAPRTAGEEDEQALNNAFVAAESLLGEERLDKWIGPIEVGPLDVAASGGASRLVPLENLGERVEALIGSIRDQLPPQPCGDWLQEEQWSCIELKPTEAEDYAEQTDLFVAVTARQDLWTAAHSGSLFASERFSRFGETFAYVKIDGSEGLEESSFEGRDEIEEAINAALTPEGLGVSIGGGTGLRYSYIDLALADLHRSVQTVRSRLQQGRLPRRTWILFFDADLCGEWVGLYDDTPAPPMLEGEEEEDA